MKRVVPPLRPNPKRELDDEFRFHIEAEVERLMEQGISETEARAKALAAFGDVRMASDACLAADAIRHRQERRARIADVLRQDATHALRSALRRPGTAAAIVLTLALGVGANAAVFTVVDRLFLRLPSGVADAGALRQIYVKRQRARPADASPQVATPVTYQARFPMPEARIFDSTIAAAGFPSAIWLSADSRVDLDGQGERTLRAGWGTSDFFDVLGVQPSLGAPFRRESEMRAEQTVALLSWHLWQRAFGGDPSVIGRVIRVDEELVRVAGVLPRGFIGVDVGAVDLWLPIIDGRKIGRMTARWEREWGLNAFRIIARISDAASERRLATAVDVGIAEANAAFRVALPRVARGRGPSTAIAGSIMGSRGPDGMTKEETIAALLAGVALLVAVIAAANVANLLVIRAIERRREIAVRLALGMSRGRLASQVLVESMLFGGAAAIAAALLGGWIGGWLRAVLMPGIQWGAGPIDLRMALVTGTLGLAAGLVAGLAPLVMSLRTDLTRSLRAGVREGGGRRSTTRTLLLSVQAALSVVLLAGTALLARSLHNVRSIDLGIDLDHVVVVDAPDSVRDDRLLALASHARSLPGVQSVALAAEAPLVTRAGSRGLFTREGDSVRTVGTWPAFVAAEPGYLRTVGTPLRRGRDFTPADRFGAPPVIIVSEDFAKRVWPGREAVGQCLRIEDRAAECATVVGVAADANAFRVIEDVEPVFYVPLDQRPERDAKRLGAGALVVRTAGDPAPIAASLREALRDTLSSRTARRVWTTAELLSEDYRPWVTGARLFAVFAATALLLAAVGLFGVLSHIVASRQHEIGVRMALGSDRSRVIGLIAREGGLQLSIGVIAGVVITLLASGKLRGILYEVSPRDPVAIGTAVAVFAVAASVAALLPARRAARVNVMNALRED